MGSGVGVCKGVGWLALLLRFIENNPINTSPIPLQDPVLNHVASNGCGVLMVGGNDCVEFFFGVFGVRGKLACDYL